MGASTESKIKEIWKILEETTRKQKENAVALGDLGNKFGSYTAGLLAPSVKEILQTEFGCTSVSEHVTTTYLGETQEFDLIGVTNGKKNEVILVEIKSKLTEGELKKFEKKFADFFRLTQGYRGYTLKGMLAAVEMPKGMPERVASRGFYLMRSDAKSFALLPTPKDFKPRTIKG